MLHRPPSFFFRGVKFGMYDKTARMEGRYNCKLKEFASLVRRLYRTRIDLPCIQFVCFVFFVFFILLAMAPLVSRTR